MNLFSIRLFNLRSTWAASVVPISTKQRTHASVLLHRPSALFLVLSMALLTSACGNAKPAAKTSESAEGPDPSIIYAENWSEIAIDANLAKTKVTSTGHYTTTRNACGRPADGALELAEWNTFARNMNQALKNVSATSPKVCFEVDYRACMDGVADLVRDDGTKLPIFERGPSGNGEICSRIPNQELAKNLYKTINGLVWSADRKDCSLEWERCSR